MPGTTIPLFPRRVFDYTNVATSSVIETILVKAIDASQYTEGTLLVRVHSANTSVTGGATLDVIVKTTAPTPEDPATDFVNSTAVATATIDSTVSTAKPTLVKASLSSNFGGMLQISIKATQATGQTIKGELSADLVLKS